VKVDAANRLWTAVAVLERADEVAGCSPPFLLRIGAHPLMATYLEDQAVHSGIYWSDASVLKMEDGKGPNV